MVFVLGLVTGIVFSLVVFSALVLYSAAKVDHAAELGSALELQKAQIRSLRPVYDRYTVNLGGKWTVDAGASVAAPNQ